ncbi:MAG: PEP/pyruvate-binding domain-containing protein [Chloroflexota bacterium]|nr:PEP/pyruvate-binding domain-containing protein [Chloroflexota bacterium]
MGSHHLNPLPEGGGTTPLPNGKGTGAIKWLADCQGGAPDIGGKAAGLGEMLSLGLRVPPGFVVTQGAYESFLATTGIERQVRALAALGDDLHVREAAAAEVRGSIESGHVSEGLAEHILDAYDQLAGSCGMTTVTVAVRSSASAEDLPGASFAGQQDTYLGISRSNLLEAIRRCWASLFSERAVAYRTQMGFPLGDVGIAVVVQKLVNARASGVMFTINPVTGNPFEIVIEANWGLGESVASGMVVPDRFAVAKSGGTLRRELGLKTQAAVVGLGGHRMIDLPQERQSSFCLEDTEVAELARLGRLMEEHYGEPRDVEWTVDADLPFPDSILLLQMRPVTTTGLKEWHRQPGKNATDHILDMLIAKRFERPARDEA